MSLRQSRSLRWGFLLIRRRSGLRASEGWGAPGWIPLPCGCPALAGPPSPIWSRAVPTERDRPSPHRLRGTLLGLSIFTNVASLGVQRHLFNATEGLNQSFSRLSSGLRITKAADDAAGLGISENMRAEVRSLSVAERNIQDGIGLVQTADAALGQTMDILARIRELAVQASSETLTTEDRDVLTTEYDELVDEMGRVIADAEFNGVAAAEHEHHPWDPDGNGVRTRDRDHDLEFVLLPGPLRLLQPRLGQPLGHGQLPVRVLDRTGSASNEVSSVPRRIASRALSAPPAPTVRT